MLLPYFLPIRLTSLTLLVTFLVLGCEKPTEVEFTRDNSLQPAEWSQLGKLPSNVSALSHWAEALRHSAGYYEKVKADRIFRFGTYRVPARKLAQACRDLAKLAQTGNAANLHRHLTEKYLLFRSVGRDGQGEVLVTAYYEPLLKGSMTPSERFHHPLYRRPEDLLTGNPALWFPELKGKKFVARVEKGRLVPYFDRQEIDKKKRLAEKKLELVWVDDPVDAFFLQIQGSGRVLLENGTTLRVGYAGANGHPYRSIGRLLIKEKKIPRAEMNLPNLRKWLQEHPDDRDRILFSNPSYVFFRKLEGGPFGNIQVSLTTGHSIATDYRLFPKGAPTFLETTLPTFAADNKTITEWRSETRFTANQDTGGAIRGPGRVDLFLGFGSKAEQVAGVMKQTNSRLYFIAPKKEEAVPAPQTKGWWQIFLSWFR